MPYCTVPSSTTSVNAVSIISTLSYLSIQSRPFMLQMLSAWLFLLSSAWLISPTTGAHQLRIYEMQALLQLRTHLEHPSPLRAWDNHTDLCAFSSPPRVAVACEYGSVTELQIMGDKQPAAALSRSFSVDSFVTTLTRLSRLKLLTLVSLGIWGPLPGKIHRLSSLRALDMTSNFLSGSIPPEMSRMHNLQTLTFNDNFFNSTVPDWLNSLTNLTRLSLKNNRFEGNFPISVSRIDTLVELVLSHNLLSGKLPDLHAMSNLKLLDLRENSLDSRLPPLPKGLENAFLSSNSFSGGVPEQFEELNRLQHLDISGNYLSGSPPVVLFSLPDIVYLNLSSNSLSGSLPKNLNCGDTLGLVDLSHNRLIDHLPNCLLDGRTVRISGNCFSFDSQNQHPAAYCEDKGGDKKGETSIVAGVLGGIVGVFILLVLLVCGFVFFCKRHNAKQTSIQRDISPKVNQDNGGISPELLANARIVSEVAKMDDQSAAPYTVFSVKDMEAATKNFDQSTFLGQGSIGKVYKGTLENDTVVAIRSLAPFRKYSIRNLRLRLDLLSKLRHPHLVDVVGHCIDGDDSTVNRLFLVQEFVSNGNFRSHLSETLPEKALKWSQRLSVVIGIAKAVHFLHTGMTPPCFSNNLKTNNVLLDEHGIAKLSDFGMSIISNETAISQVKADPAKSGQNVEDDVYNFGLILLESLVGSPIGDQSFLVNEMAMKSSFSSQDGWLKMVDPVVLTTSSQESLSTVISITNKCVSIESSSRPSIEDVLWNLQYAAQVQATFDDADV